MLARLREGPLRALSHPIYARVWAGAFISNVGTWMETIGVGVYVTQTTGRAGWTGTVAALAFLPSIVIGPLGGALADRFERRQHLTAVNVAQTVCAALLMVLALSGHLSVPAVALLVTVNGFASTLGGPAYNALMADLVPPKDLLSAITLSSAQFNLARVVGPMLAALAIAAGGLGAAFGLNALSFLAVVISLSAVPSMRPHGAKEPILAGIRAGLVVAREDQGIRRALMLITATSVLIAPFIGLVPAFAIKTLERGASGASLLVTAQGLGAVLSAVASSSFADRYGRRRLLVGATWAIGPVAALYWLAPSYPFALVAMFCLGALYLAVVTSSSTVCLARAPKPLQARVSSLYSSLLGTGYALGVVVMGWLGDVVGLPAAGAAAAALYLTLLLVARLRHPQVFESVAAPKRLPTLETLAPTPVAPGPAEVKIAP